MLKQWIDSLIEETEADLDFTTESLNSEQLEDLSGLDFTLVDA